MNEQQSFDREWLSFRKALEGAIGVPLGQYKEPQMKRRLASLMTRGGFVGWPQFEKAITSDGALLAQVRDTLTINVSEFFRQADRFQELRDVFIPRLEKAAGGRALKIWSAGCSIGCEPYTLAIILDELNPNSRHSIIATDVDMPALARAKEGRGYLPGEVRSVAPAVLKRHFAQEQDGTYRVADTLKRRIQFRRQDLLSDAYPADVDLILCRNVVIYFTDEAKSHIYSGFAKALRPGGLLFIGGSEMIMRSHELGFRTAATSMYSKAA
ncbi:MAG: protein-glutamate O-methyltransferase CheR [Dehalococcoidia bacterium]|nr:protein-glutamate O-methyltransferase CheR [Dehalococcoidia bacterium]